LDESLAGKVSQVDAGHGKKMVLVMNPGIGS